MCFSCFVQIDGWKRNSCPWNEHEKRNKDCKFIQLHETGNIPLPISIRNMYLPVQTYNSDCIQRKITLYCSICFDNQIEFVFLPCGHVNSCRNCSEKFKKCPICRQLIRQKVRVYI